MTLPLTSSRYSTAIYSYTPPPSGNPSTSSIDQQTAQAALGHIINRWREQRASDKSGSGTFQTPPPPSRWFLQVRSLRLTNPFSNANAPPRTMYMIRNAAIADQCTLVIEDTTAKAVNISTVQSHSFDHFMSVNLLPAQAGKSSGQGNQGPHDASSQGATQHITQLQASNAPRWIPRPSYVQIEGVTMMDVNADFRLQVGMLSARGGAAGASSSSICPNLIIQLEYTAAKTLPLASYNILHEYLIHVLPLGSKIRDISADTTALDWNSLLGIQKPILDTDTEEEIHHKMTDKEWTPRNSGWCIVKMCKEAKLV